jgi:hypothetical protein
MARRGAAWPLLLAALSLAALSSCAHALYSSSGPVVSVTDADYKAKMKGLVLLELYAPCVPVGGCRSAARARLRFH